MSIVQSIIMAGGVGERLWPLSQNSLPKQFIKFLDGKSLLQKTLERNKNFSPLAVIVRKEHMHLAKEQITEVGIKADIIIEPEGRNTAPCAIIAAIYGMEKKAKHILLLPVDHMIHGQSRYVSSVQEALNISTSQNIVTFGVKPFKAYSGYGYLKAGQALSSTIFTIEKFIEKPPLEIATEYLASGNYYWNSGIFVFKPEYIMYLASVMEPKMYSLSLKAFYQMKQEENCLILDADAYKQIKGNSIDYAFIEKSENIKMLKVNFSWQDVGSWSSMWEISEKDINNNVIKGPSYGYNNFGSYIYSEQTPATVIGVKDLIIVNTPRGLLVMHKSKSDKLKIILDDIRSKIGLDYTKSQD